MQRSSQLNMIGKIISLIMSWSRDDMSGSFVATVLSLAKECRISVAQTRKYIDKIFNNKILSSSLYDDEIDAFLTRIRSGEADDELIETDNDFIERLPIDNPIGKKTILPITPAERVAFDSNYLNFTQPNKDPLFRVKSGIRPVSKRIMKLRHDVKMAMFNKCKISFEYNPADKKKFKREVLTGSPIKIEHSKNTNKFWIKAFGIKAHGIKPTDAFLYRLDRIIGNIEILKKQPSDIDTYTPSPYIDNFWSEEFQTDETPRHIKFRLDLSLQNIERKFTRDIENRKEATTIKAEDGKSLVYTDNVLGTWDFLFWLRGYGYSIKMLEPAEIVKKVKDEAQQTLDYYNMLAAMDDESK